VDRALGVLERLRQVCLDAYDRLIGLELSEVAVDCCVTKAQKAEARRREAARWIGANGASSARWRWTPGAYLGKPVCSTSAPANHHDSPLLAPTLMAATETLGSLPEETSVHLENAATTRRRPTSDSRS
jgi:hypothetical protein